MTEVFSGNNELVDSCVKRYAEGASIREIAEDAGRSYGWVTLV